MLFGKYMSLVMRAIIIYLRDCCKWAHNIQKGIFGMELINDSFRLYAAQGKKFDLWL